MTAHSPLRRKDFRAVRHHRGPALDVPDLAARLTVRDRWLLRMLYEHRVLTSPQIATLAFGAPRLARRRLLQLVGYGVIARFTPLKTTGSWPAHYILAPTGARVLAAEEGLDPEALRWRYDRATAIAVSIHLAHTIGVADWFTALVDHARHHRDHTLTAWWSQVRCQRLWGDLVRPDAYGHWSTHHQPGLDFFLEYDLGTGSLTQLTRKLDGYAHLAQATTITTTLLIWLPTGHRETHARTALHAAWRALPNPHTVPIATATPHLLTPGSHAGPADRLWLPLGTHTERVRLHQLPAHWPHYRPPEPHTSEPASDPEGPNPTILPAPDPTPPHPERGAR